MKNSNNKINNTNNCTKIFIFLKSRATGYPANRIQSEREIKKACWNYNNIDDANSVYKWNNFSSPFYSNLQFLFSDCTKPKEMTTNLGGMGGLRNGRDDFCSSEIIIQIYLMLFFLNKKQNKIKNIKYKYK